MRVALPIALLLALAALVAPAPAGALVVHRDTAPDTPDPAAPPPPAEDPGWDLVGEFAGRDSTGAAVYLGVNPQGEGWILSVRHLGKTGTFTLDGVTYDTDLWLGFTNPNGMNADVLVLRLVGGPGTAGIPAIASATPAAGTPLTTVGAGHAQGAFTCWNAAWSPGSCLGAAHSGYPWISPRPKQWGTNLVAPGGAALDAAVEQLGIDEEVFSTGFDSAETWLETQGATGDSGGGGFVPDGAGGWELAGLTQAIFGLPSPGRPSHLAALDEDLTIYIDLSYYSSEILAKTGVVLPEPTGAGPAGLGLLAALSRSRRRSATRA